MLGGGAVRDVPGHAAGVVTHRDAEYYVFGRVLQAEPAIVTAPRASCRRAPDRLYWRCGVARDGSPPARSTRPLNTGGDRQHTASDRGNRGEEAT